MKTSPISFLSAPPPIFFFSSSHYSFVHKIIINIHRSNNFTKNRNLNLIESTMNRSLPTDKYPSQNDADLNQGPRQSSETNDSTPPPPTTEVLQLQDRIAFLERELIEARLQVAVAASSEDFMRLKLTKMSAELAMAKEDNKNLRSASPSHDLDAADEDDAIIGNQNVLGHHHNINDSINVPTTNPFLRKSRVHRAGRQMSGKVLKKGSCSSGINLLALAQLDPQGGSMSSLSSLGLQRPTRPMMNGARRNGSSGVLNPDSCASGLNLLMGLTASGARSVSRGSLGNFQQLRSTSSAAGVNNVDAASRNANIAHLLDLMGNINARTSNSSISNLMDNACILSASSLSDGNTPMGRPGSGNSNADWDLFE